MVMRDVCVSPRARSGAVDDASLWSSSCVHAEGAADTLRETRDEAEVDASCVGVEYDHAVGPVGDVGEARRSRGGGCGGVSPSYGFGNKDLPSSVSVLGAALCIVCVSRRPTDLQFCGMEKPTELSAASHSELKGRPM